MASRVTEEYHSWPARTVLAMWGTVFGLWTAVPLKELGGTALEDASVAAWFAFIAIGVWRGATVRVKETADGLTVRNMFRTYSIRWTDVTGVGWCERWETRWWSDSPCVYVRGRRRRIPLLGMTKSMRRNATAFDHRVTAAVTRWRSR